MVLCFWLLVALLVYLHGGYAIVLFLIARARQVVRGRLQVAGQEETTFAPPLTVLVGAYNEEAVMGAKLESLLGQDYSGSVSIVVASDRSTDGTEEIARSFAAQGVRLDVAPTRQGKAANFSRLVPGLATPLVVCTDAASLFAPDALRRLVAAFKDPTVGLVGGRVHYRNVSATGVSRGEGLYWRYEVALRALESRLGGTVIVSGACYAIRRNLFRSVPPELPDDFMSPLHVWDQGFRVLYEPAVRVDEEVATTLKGEFATKARIISRNFAALWRMRHLLNPLRGPGLAIKLLSHRLLRWLVAPLLLVVLLLSGLLAERPPYRFFLAAQVIFYVLAAAGLWPRARESRLVWIPFYFCVVNLAAAVGVWRGLTGRISGTWTPVERQDRG